MRVNFKKTDSGFTAIEILVAIAIVVLLSVITFTSFSNLNRKEILDKESLKILSVIQDARSLTLSSKNSSQYGVYFEEDRIISFAGSTYNSSNPNNLETTLSSRVSITSIALNGVVSEVVFERLSGKTSQFGTVTLSLVSDSSLTKTIRIFETGLLEID